MQIGQQTQSEQGILKDYWKVLNNAIDPQNLQARSLFNQVCQNQLIIRQNEVIAYSALYASFLSNITPFLYSLRNQAVHFQNLDLTRFSNDLQVALDGMDAFNFAVKHVSQELKEGEFTAETLERVTPHPTLIEFLREQLSEARYRDEKFSEALAKAETEKVALRNKLTKANKKNAHLMNSLEDAERDILDLEDALKASKEKTSDEDSPMFR